MLAAFLATPPAPAQDKREDACGAAIDCDCENIAGAGILTAGWKADCRRCEARILASCRRSYENGALAQSAIGDALQRVGYCQNACSQIGPSPRPIPSEKRAAEDAQEAAIPQALKPMRLLCALNERLRYVTHEGVWAVGCMRGNRRNGLWRIRNEPRSTEHDVYYRDGREVWRRERRPG
jgi:hypothetical protein